MDKANLEHVFPQGTSSTQTARGAGNIQAGRDVNISPTRQSSKEDPIRDVVDELEPLMGDLFGVLRTALSQNALIRECFVLPTRSVILGGSSVPRFRFNVDEIPDLLNKVQIVEGHGLLVDVTPKNTPIFRMSEAFVARLTRGS